MIRVEAVAATGGTQRRRKRGAQPVELSIVDSIGRPGGNVTGTSSLSADVSLKQLQLLTEMVPGARRIAVLSAASSPWHPIATVDGLA